MAPMTCGGRQEDSLLSIDWPAALERLSNIKLLLHAPGGSSSIITFYLFIDKLFINKYITNEAVKFTCCLSTSELLPSSLNIVEKERDYIQHRHKSGLSALNSSLCTFPYPAINSRFSQLIYGITYIV